MSSSTVEWSDDFLIGIDELDYEHKTLIADINTLHDELFAHDTREHIAATLGSIHARMQSHFALEEHVMRENDYPHFSEHKAEHDKLLDTYTEFMIRYRNDQEMSDMKTVEETLRSWIISHITGSDKRMSLMIAGT